MAEFLVRVSPGYSFARENLEGQGYIWHKLSEYLNDAAILAQRYTFGVYRLSAHSKEDCEKAVRDAWRAAFPDDSETVSVLVSNYDGTDTSTLMQSIYTGYYGVESYQAMTTELTESIPRLKARGAMRALRMQNYLFAIDQGCGFSTVLASFGDYLRRMNVYEEESEDRVRFIEYIMNKETVGETASADTVIESFKDEEHENDGIVGIDISYYLDGDKTDELRRFIRRLYEYQDRFVFVFRVPFLERRALDKLAATLSDVMLLRVVEIPPMNECVMLEYLWDCMRRLGYMADVSIIEPFLFKVQSEKKDGRFYGFKTVEKIAHEMVLKKAGDARLSGNGDGETISAVDLDGLYCEKAEKSGYDALSELIGMEEIRDRVREIVSQVKVAIKNEKLDKPCIHMRFLGAPGTGKTTVARIVGQIFREEGILRKGSLLEYSARSLCAEYVGQTAVKTASICRDAYGSVLFIDEAYALYDTDINTNDYGKEALTTLISEMENHRDDMLVIMAGYTEDMETLMKGNAGLRSRMPYAIEFKNYTRQQLFEIFMMMVKKHFEYDADLESAAKTYFLSLSDSYIESKQFANARFVRNLYERTWSKAALRTSLAGLSDITLLKEDFSLASSEKEFSEKTETKNKIGF